MLNRKFVRFVSFILVGLFWSLNLASASAAGLPVLTWEAGKEQSITMTTLNHNNWDLFLVGQGQNIKFQPTHSDSNGLQYFKIKLPIDQKLGSYLIQAQNGELDKKVIAGVGIIKLKTFDVLSIPSKLIEICATFLFMLVGFNTLRDQKYSRIEYLRPKRVSHSNRILNALHNFRLRALDDIQPSLFKFQVVKEGELLANISPWVWAMAPFAFFGFGAFSAVKANLINGLSVTPLSIYTLIAIGGVFDPLSGFAASGGFLISSAIYGNISNIQVLMSALAFVSGWFLPGLTAAIFQEVIRKDWIPKLPRALRTNIPEVLAAAIGSNVYYCVQLITNSFADRLGPVVDLGRNSSYVVAIIIFARIKLDHFLIKDLHLRGENYQIRTMNLPRIIAPKSVIALSFYFLGAMFAWTGDLKFSLVAMIIFLISLSLLLVRFESLVIAKIAILNRHVLFEASFVVALALLAYIYIGLLPLDVLSKGEYLLLVTGIALLIHAIYSAIHDVTSRPSRLAVELDSLGASPGSAGAR